MEYDLVNSQYNRKWRMPDPYEFSTYYSGRNRDSQVISVPVKTYMYGNGRKVTVLACVDLEYTDRLFYQIEVSKTNEMNITKEVKSMKTIQNLLTKYPISWKAFRKAEAKITHMMAEQSESKKQSALLQKEEIRCNNNVNDTKFKINDDNDDCYGGVLGVYARGD